MDLLPTLVAMADPGGKPVTGIDGQNILPVLNGGAPDHEFLFWSYNNSRSVRQGDWKLILNPTQFPGDPVPDKVWLSNLEADPGEKRNLAGEEPTRVKQLMDKLRAWELDVKIPAAQ
jgi:arylsulfatase A-like enzyme